MIGGNAEHEESVTLLNRDGSIMNSDRTGGTNGNLSPFPLAGRQIDQVIIDILCFQLIR